MAHLKSIELILNNEILSDPIVKFHLEEIGIDVDKIKDYYANYSLLFEEIFNYITAKNNNFMDVSKIRLTSLKNSNLYRTLLSSNIYFGPFYKDIFCQIIKYLDIPSFFATACVCKKIFCFMMSDNIINHIKTEYLQKTMLLSYYDETVSDKIYDRIVNAKKNKMHKKLKYKYILIERNITNKLNDIFKLAVKKENLELLKEITKQKKIKMFDYQFAIDYMCYVGNKTILNFLLDKVKPDINNSLMYACYFGHDDICKLVFHHKKKAIDNILYNEAVLLTEKRGHYELFKFLVTKNNNYLRSLNDNEKNHHLCKSVKGGNLDIVKYWVEQEKTYINICNDRKIIRTRNDKAIHIRYNALRTAVRYGRYKITKYLINNSDNISIKHPYTYLNLLSLACYPKNKYNPNTRKIIRLLLDLNLDVQHYAIKDCDNDVLIILVEESSKKRIKERIRDNLSNIVKNGFKIMALMMVMVVVFMYEIIF